MTEIFVTAMYASGLLAALIHYQINPDWIHFQLTRNHYTEPARNLSGRG